MKKTALFIAVTLLIFGTAGNLWAYEGGTKAVAAMGSPAKGEWTAGPLLLVPGHELTPSKLIQGFLYRMPEPTLAAERIREEKPGLSTGTKSVVLFQRGWKG